MTASFADIVSYFTEATQKPHIDEEKQMVRATYGGDAGSLRAAVRWNSDAERVDFRIGNIATVPESRREAACVLINRINWRVASGNLELDMEDGEVAYRLAFYVLDGTLGHKQIEANLHVTLSTVERMYPVLQRFLWADLSPEEALATLDD